MPVFGAVFHSQRFAIETGYDVSSFGKRQKAAHLLKIGSIQLFGTARAVYFSPTSFKFKVQS
jgi:hypothetical protein